MALVWFLREAETDDRAFRYLGRRQTNYKFYLKYRIFISFRRQKLVAPHLRTTFARRAFSNKMKN
jgi:hypothetical protein